ncbi:hypothetical protein KSS87_011223 [Heliosperma pusillum]|nr:hypothetical protein KSS87_011223 [Heliosperma pusillum]
MEVKKEEKIGEEDGKTSEEKHQNCNSKVQQNPEARKGKSCKGTLYFSSILKSKGKNPRCVGFTRSLQQVPNYIVSESEVEASKEGRSLTDFRYACVGYSVYLDNKGAQTTGDKKPRAELPVCVGLEGFVQLLKLVRRKHPSLRGKSFLRGKMQQFDHSQHIDSCTSHFGFVFLQQTNSVRLHGRFTRNAGLVASGVARNMRKVGHYVKESVDDILYKRPK